MEAISEHIQNSVSKGLSWMQKKKEPIIIDIFNTGPGSVIIQQVHMQYSIHVLLLFGNKINNHRCNDTTAVLHFPTLPSDWSVLGFAVTACTATISSLMLVCKCLSSLICNSLSTFAASFSAMSPKSNPHSLAVGLYCLFLHFQSLYSVWCWLAASIAESENRSSITILTASKRIDGFGCSVTCNIQGTWCFNQVQILSYVSLHNIQYTEQDGFLWSFQ